MSVTAEQLLALCTAAREGSVTAAARSLGLSQPAVSRQLLALRDAVGSDLYRRSGRGIELTDAGRALLPYACSVAEALSAARRWVGGERDDEAVALRVGLSHHLTPRLTAPLLAAAREHGGGASHGEPASGAAVHLHLLEAYSRDLIARSERGELDAAYLLRTGAADRDASADDDLPGRATTVGEERIVLLVKPDDPLGRGGPLPLSALEGEAVVLPSSASLVYRRVVAALERAAVRPGKRIEVSGPAAVRSAALGGMGIGVSVESFVRSEVEADTLRSVPIDAPGLVLRVVRATRTEPHLSPAAAQALRQLTDSL